MENEFKMSKLLSLILRHNPDKIGITLDKNRWVDVNILLANIKKEKVDLTFSELKGIVDNNNKKRFAFSDDFKKIRASQGHSLEIDLDYKEQKPPDILFHGTATKNLNLILTDGIKKMSRHHVHLSQDVVTALQVGKRHGKPLILKVDSIRMYSDRFVFYLSENNVWLTEFVPAQYLKIDE